MSDDPSQPRQPRNVTDLLRFCAEVEANPDETNVVPMSDERREWLQTALAEMTVDHVSTIRSHLKVISATSNDPEEREEALKELVSLCDNIDFAQDFHKIGGYSVLSEQFSDPNPGIRTVACELVAILVQNNEYCQQQALESGWMKRLMEMLDSDPSEGVRVKSMYALSCLVRNNKASQAQFSSLDGLSALMRAMHTGVDKLKVKAAFLLASLVNEQPSFKDTLIDIGMVEQLVGNLREEHSTNHEHFMSTLLALVTDHQRAVSECRRPELNLVLLLRERIAKLDGLEEFLEEKSYAQSILDICFANKDNQER